MRLSRVAAPVAVFLGAGIACAPAPAQLSPADVSAIGQVSDAFLKGFVARDFDAVAGLYLEDAVLNAPNHPAQKGRAAVKAFLEGFPPVREFTSTREVVDGRGDLAFVYGTYAMTVAPPGAPEIKDSGKYVEIRRKQADGRWLIAVDIFNSDLPVAPPPAPASSPGPAK